ncbi:YIEGIA protein [Desulfuribacillus stibiiarsenatis]|uniref:YIEGIA protein n=1 Tax=Desulfuribacillus stibiiarsenatis TaxID=1390249 RepID=A0A1E5L4Q9_9FIRM|nr:YIEGIA domain-containing protein [Desulfuribacillus stibiiarsenatis]OEH85100.1 YIEGIA protein [Desulfuribacillus stibiiarsenatis]
MENGKDIISPEFLLLIVTATIIGTLARVLSIKMDYRQYPNYPNGYLIHVVTGVVAAALGAFIIPTLMTKNFTAVTFLALAIQQFREVRKIERKSLLDLEGHEYTKRGDAYIDGIAKIFESRNYVALLVAFTTAFTIQMLESYADVTPQIKVIAGSMIGLIVYFLLKYFTKRLKIQDIATVTEGKIEIKGSEMYVDNIFITNVLGEEEAQQWMAGEGVAAVIHPKKEHFRIPLENPGQRQAILFETTRRLGQRRYSFQNPGEGKVVIALIPIIQNFNLFKETILLTPILETVKKTPELLGKTPGEVRYGK